MTKITTVTKVSKPRKQKRNPPSQREKRTTVVTTKRQGRTRSRIPRGLGQGLAMKYMRCLADPFNNAPVRAGYGCMVPTEVHTAYLRSYISTAADGSFAMYVLPSHKNLLAFTIAGFGNVPVYTSAGLYPAGNSALLSGLFNSCRTLAMGARLYPMVAATSTPGVIQMGLAPRAALHDLVAPKADTDKPVLPAEAPLFNNPVQYAANLPYLREHMSRPGGADFLQVTWRPTDNKDFEFHDCDMAKISLGANTSFQPFYTPQPVDSTSDGSFLVITGQSMPASTNIFVEVILHMECTNTNATIQHTDSAANSPSVADAVPSTTFESMYRSISQYLPTVDSVVGAAGSLLASPLGVAASRRYHERILGVRADGYHLV